jgi:hypothetical protein
LIGSTRQAPARVPGLGQSFRKLTHLPRLKTTTFHGCISSRLNIQTTRS